MADTKSGAAPVPTLKLEEVPKDMMANQKEMREWVKRTDGLVNVPFKNIRIRTLKGGKRFNRREDMGDLVALADSIAEIGLIHPLDVYILEDGLAIIEDGERRYRAIEIVRGRSMELKQQFEYVTCKLSTNVYTDNDRLIIQMTANTGKPFEPMEEAEIFKTLVETYKMNMPEIARKTGKSVPYIEQRLILANASSEEKDLISKKKIKPTAFVALTRKEKDKDKRVATIKESVSKGKRVKVKDVKSSGAADLCNEAIQLIKDANELNKNGKVENVLFELDAKIREIKKAVK